MALYEITSISKPHKCLIVLYQNKSLSLTHPRTVALAVQGDVPLWQVLGQVEPLGGEVKWLVLVESLLGGNLLLLQAQSHERHELVRLHPKARCLQKF